VYISPCPERNRITERVTELGGQVVQYPDQDTVILLTERQCEVIQNRPPRHLVSNKLYRAEAIEDLPIKEKYRVRIKGFDEDGRKVEVKKKIRCSYTLLDDAMILFYLKEVVTEAKKEVNVFKDEVWKKVEQKFVCSNHSWQSMQERYINRLKDISEFERNRLLKLVEKAEAEQDRKAEVEARENEIEQISSPKVKRAREETSPKSVKEAKRDSAVSQKIEFASEEEIKKGIEIIKKRNPNLSNRKIAHALLCTSGNFKRALDYLETGNTEHLWTYSQDAALVGGNKDQIMKITNERSAEEVLLRARFLSNRT
jgi:hypothetical protein